MQMASSNSSSRYFQQDFGRISNSLINPSSTKVVTRNRHPPIKSAMVTDARPTKTDDRFNRKPRRVNGIDNPSSMNTSLNFHSNDPISSAGEDHQTDQAEPLVSVQDYMEQSLEIIKPDNGPPRWFCPLNCGKPNLPDSPLLLFLPGIEGTGLGLILHHKALGPLFEVRCLHIPVRDRTPFEGLLKLVENTVKAERSKRPIYLVGDSFGGCLALAVAARNPSIDLVLVLANPATSIARSPLQPFFPLFDLIPDTAFQYVPYIFSFTMGDPVRMAAAKIPKDVQEPLQRSQKVANALTDLLPTLPNLSRILPRETLIWKLKLIRSAAAYANSRLHAVKAEVLILASAKDQLLRSEDEAKRLKRALQNCKVRIFKDSGHTLLLDETLG